MADLGDIHALLADAPLVDGHNDLLWEMRERVAYDFDAIDIAAGAPGLMTDIPRLRAGGLGAQFWSVYVPSDLPGDTAVTATLEQLDGLHMMLARHPRDLEFALTADDVERVVAAGRIACLAGMEGGQSIGAPLGALRMMYALGARYMTLTHNHTNAWADSATDEPQHDGLSTFGEEVVREMNRLGMLVDLSHVAPSTMKDAIAASRAPVIFSHSDVHALNPHPRSVPDDVLRLLPANGGVIMITFVPPFLSGEVWAWQRERSAEEARLKSLYSFSKARVDEGLKAWEAAHPRPEAQVASVADHIEHAVKVAGHDHVGIGGDLDGIPYGVAGLAGVEGYPNLFAELIRRGWSDGDLAKLAGGNILRVMRRAEAVAAAMKDEPPSLASLPAEADARETGQ